MRHPTGPNLPGHPACGPGKIFDHVSQRCISLNVYKKKNGADAESAASGTRYIVRGAG